MALHREKRKYKTKSGKVAYRSVMVAAQGKPQMRMRLKEGGPAKSGAPRKGAILGAVVGAFGGAAIGAAGGAAYGAASAPGKLHAAFRHVSGPYYNPLQDPNFMRQHSGRIAGMTATHVARSSTIFGVAGAVAGAASGAVAGYVAGHGVAAISNRRSRGLKSAGPPHPRPKLR